MLAGVEPSVLALVVGIVTFGGVRRHYVPERFLTAGTLVLLLVIGVRLPTKVVGL